MKNKITFEVKMDEELYNKFRAVAEAEGRSLDAHIALLARNNVAYYERSHASGGKRPKLG